LYLKSLQENGSITGKVALRSMTVQGYALAINTLFELWGFQAPINPSDPNNVGNIVISNLSKEENISRKRNCSLGKSQTFGLAFTQLLSQPRIFAHLLA